MESIFLNGGIIGPTLNFGSTEKYIVDIQQQRVRPTLVGQQTYTRAGSTSAVAPAFNLSGGIGTTPAAGDIVVLAIALGAAATTLMTAPAGYTQIAHFASNDTYDAVLYVGYKIMGSTPDTTFPIPSALSTSNSQMAIVSVWRGVDQTTPIDVSTVTATGIDSRLANPPAITPVTENAIVIGIGATAYSGTVYTFSAGGNLTGFVSASGSDTYDGALGLGYHEWVSGQFDPTAFSITGTTTSDSWASATLALRPAITEVPIYGNYKNSGIWPLSAVYDYLKPGVPITIPGLKLWLDADDSGTLTYTSGTNISTWSSKVGGTIYTTTSAVEPGLSSVPGLNKPAVLFPINQVSYLKTNNAASIGVPQTVFIVAHWATITSTYASIGLTATDMTNALQGATGVPYVILYTSTAGNGLPQLAVSGSGYTFSSTGIPENSAGLLEYTFNTNMTDSNIALNGSNLTRTTGTATSPSTVSYNVIGTSDTLYKSGGAFAEILVYEGILTESQKTTIRTYLKNKWGTP